jgi:hypothetical protein
MPNLLKQIPETMRKQGISKETLAQFTFSETGNSEVVMDLINQMDKLLSKEQCLSIMQEQGCCKSGIGPKAHTAFGSDNAGKPLAEKIELLNGVEGMPHKAPCRLNDDGTLSVYWGAENMRGRSCPCGFTGKLPDDYVVPLTFCGCCGGHIRNNYQKSLGVKLQLKEIVSSSSSSNGKKRCEFLYRIEK